MNKLTNQQALILQKGFELLSIDYTEQHLDQFGEYLSLIQQYNKKFNLTRLLGDDAVTGHFLDALTIVLIAPSLKSNHFKVVDGGSGVGVPGIPLKIMFPELQVTLIDADQKRVGFLEFVCTELGLKNIRAYAGRLEELSAKDQYKSQFDFAIARALAEPDEAIKLITPYLKPNGEGILYLSKVALKEGMNFVVSPFNTDHIVVKF